MIDFVVPPMFYVGLYALFALIFALFGGLCAKKYKWQYAITKVVAVALSAFLSILILKSVSAMVGRTIIDIVAGFINDADIASALTAEGTMTWMLGIFGVIFTFVFFVPLFALLKAVVNLIFKLIAKAIFRAIPEKEEKTEPKASAPIEANSEAPETLAIVKEESDTDPETAVILTDSEAEAEPVSESPAVATAASEENTTEEYAPKTKRRKTIIAEKGRGWSFLCGAVSGFMVLTVISAPLVCLLSDLGGIAAALLKGTENKVIAENLESASDNLGVDIISACGGKLIYDGIGSFSVENEKVVLGRELDFANDAVYAMSLLSSKSVSAQEKSAVIDKAVASFEDTSLIPIVLSDLIKEASQRWMNGEEYIGVSKPSLGEEGGEVVDELIEALGSSTPESMREDIASVLRLMSSAVENGAFDMLAEGENADLLKLLENEAFLTDVIKVLLENERFSDSVTTVANMGVRILAKSLGVPENDEEIYDKFINEVVNARAEAAGETDAAKVISIADKIKKAYDTAGIELPYAAEYTIAVDLVARLSDLPTADDVKAFFKNENGELDLYKDLRAFFLYTSSVFDPTQTLINRGINGEGIEELVDVVTSKFTSPKIANDVNTDISVKGYEDVASRSVRTVLPDMLIEKKEIADTDAEAARLASVISKALAMASSLSDTESMDIKPLMDKLGTLLDALAESDLVGEKTVANTVTGLLQSDFVRNTLGISSHKAATLSANIANAVKNGDTYNQHLVAIGNTVNVIVKKEEASGDTDSGDKESTESVKELIQTVTPTTSDTLKELVSEEVLTNNGLPEKTSGAVSDLFGDMFDEMARVNEENSDSEYVEKEAEAVSKALDIATTESGKFKDGVFGKEGDSDEKIKEYTELVSGSDIMSTVIVDSVYGENDTPKLDPMGFGEKLPEHEQTAVVEQLDTLYKKEIANGTSGDELKEYEKLMVSMAAFLNLNVTVEGDSVKLN